MTPAANTTPSTAATTAAAIDRTPIETCVHCGFCLPACPTYHLWQHEGDSPRGRITLIDLLERGAAASDEVALRLDNCLGCMACVSACPSGVRYDTLLVDGRAALEERRPRPLRERLLRRAIFAVAPHPRRLAPLAPLLGMRRVKLPPRLPAAPGAPRRGTVGLLQGCVQRALFGGVNAATARVLAAEGYDVEIPSQPDCCGSLAQHTGERERAIAAAKDTIRAFADVPVVVVNAAGCGSGMKDYGHLLRDDPLWADEAGRFVAKVKDVHELLAEHEPHAPRRPIGLARVAYHDACHLAHAQGVRAQPRTLLRTIPGLEVLDTDHPHCCGSAGIYNIVRPGPAAQLGAEKVAALRATGAEAVAAANPGCALQITAHGGPPVHHPMELLDQAIWTR